MKTNRISSDCIPEKESFQRQEETCTSLILKYSDLNFYEKKKKKLIIVLSCEWKIQLSRHFFNQDDSVFNIISLKLAVIFKQIWALLLCAFFKEKTERHEKETTAS